MFPFGIFSLKARGVRTVTITIVFTNATARYNFGSQNVLRNKRILAMFQESFNPEGQTIPAEGAAGSNYFVNLVDEGNANITRLLGARFFKKFVESTPLTVLPNIDGFIEFNQEVAWDKSHIVFDQTTAGNLVTGQAVTFSVFYVQNEKEYLENFTGLDKVRQAAKLLMGNGS